MRRTRDDCGTTSNKLFKHKEITLATILFATVCKSLHSFKIETQKQVCGSPHTRAPKRPQSPTPQLDPSVMRPTYELGDSQNSRRISSAFAVFSQLPAPSITQCSAAFCVNITTHTDTDTYIHTHTPQGVSGTLCSIKGWDGGADIRHREATPIDNETCPCVAAALLLRWPSPSSVVDVVDAIDRRSVVAAAAVVVAGRAPHAHIVYSQEMFNARLD